jgi:hypothetical protein
VSSRRPSISIFETTLGSEIAIPWEIPGANAAIEVEGGTVAGVGNVGMRESDKLRASARCEARQLMLPLVGWQESPRGHQWVRGYEYQMYSA